jgi:transposase
MDGKDVFRLELTDSGVDCSVRSEFRSRWLDQGAERLLFDRLLEQGRERGWSKARGKQRPDSTHVLAAVRTLRRLEGVGATLRHARSAACRGGASVAARAQGPGMGRAVGATLP